MYKIEPDRHHINHRVSEVFVASESSSVSYGLATDAIFWWYNDITC